MSNPYKGRPDYCFWPRAMSNLAPWQINPVTRSVQIKEGEKIATIGSCFAQHISRHISSIGLDYFVPECPPEGMDENEAKRRNFKVFSARYGNVYTVRQTLQLFERAFGEFIPNENNWKKGKKFVDAFRPQIEPDGFSTEEECKHSREIHLGYVREIFEKSDWLVFTLGLTEAWRSRLDGAIYPIAPGVAGGSYDPELHEFINFTAEEVRKDLFSLIEKVTNINPRIKFFLTVSPVPLMATYENRHVWVSTTFSKAALRVAVDEAERKYNNVIYFPSYEIITSPASGGNYYGDDYRDVMERGVKHVMRVFSETFLINKNHSTADNIINRGFRNNNEIICDEEILGD